MTGNTHHIQLAVSFDVSHVSSKLLVAANETMERISAALFDDGPGENVEIDLTHASIKDDGVQHLKMTVDLDMTEMDGDAASSAEIAMDLTEEAIEKHAPIAVPGSIEIEVTNVHIAGVYSRTSGLSLTASA